MPIKVKPRKRESKIKKLKPEVVEQTIVVVQEQPKRDQIETKREVPNEQPLNYHRIIPNDLMNKLDTENFYPDDLRQLFAYLKYCLDNGILNDQQITTINHIFASQQQEQVEVESARTNGIQIEQTENKIRTNLIHMGISFFIWNAQGHDTDPTLYGNLYRQKIREVL